MILTSTFLGAVSITSFHEHIAEACSSTVRPGCGLVYDPCTLGPPYPPRVNMGSSRSRWRETFAQ